MGSTGMAASKFGIARKQLCLTRLVACAYRIFPLNPCCLFLTASGGVSAKGLFHVAQLLYASDSFGSDNATK